MGRVRHSTSLGESILVGAASGAAASLILSFRPIRLLFGILCLSLAFMVFWDKFVSQSILPQSQWEFSTTPPVVDTMDGQWPTDFSPHFRLTWTFRNKSPMMVQSYQINGELYRCDTLGQPIDSCDWISRFNRKVIVNLPAGRHKTRDDLYIFNEGTTVPGILRAKIWATDVIGDNDREY